MATAVTPVGVRDGDPDALAGLCDRRGPAVLAYCEVVAGRGEIAVSAAADAFASFRAGVVAAPDLADLNPEALLISATRHAAARHAGADMPPACARVPALLAARADRSITLADHDWLVEHLAGCWTCRAPVSRFDAADRAYLDPPSTPLPPQATAAIVAALTAAAPVIGAEPEPPPVVSSNGAAPHPEQPTAYALPAVEGYVDQPTSAYQVGDLDLEPPAPAAEPAPEPVERAPVRGSRSLSRRPRSQSDGSTRRSRRGRPAPYPAAAPDAEDYGQPAAYPAAEAGERSAQGHPTPPPIADQDEPRSGGGTNLPRPQRAIAAGTGRRGRSPLRLGIVLPVALVIVVIVVALLIAGVLGGGGGGAATPQSLVPASDAPAATQRSPVAGVPDAATASAATIERTKAKARAAARRARAGKNASTPTTTATAPPAATPTAAPAANHVAGNDTAATPAKSPVASDTPKTTTATSGKPKINAGDGATGAEQLPAAKDTSTVPDLAPPAQPAAPPG